MGRYKVFDEETENHVYLKRLGNPKDPRNWIIMRGWKNQGDKQCSFSYHPEQDHSTMEIEEDITYLVGQNIKYDLLWEMFNGNEQLRTFYKRGGQIWDTQYAEYLLEGQTQASMYASLDQLAKKYGGTQKKDEVKEMWEAGMKTSEIPYDLLKDYLIGSEEEGFNAGDIGNTEVVFLAQVKRAVEQGQLLMIQARMDGLAATTEMEYNGLKIDVPVMSTQLKELTAEYNEISKRLDTYVPDTTPEALKFSWTSPIHKSVLFFGGVIKYEKQAPYKDEATGELVRTKAKEDWPLFGGEPVDPAKCSGDPVFGTSGTSYYGQDEFKSGKKKGMGKTKKVDVPGEIKVKYQDFFYAMHGYTYPDPSWATKKADGAGNPVYSLDSDIVEKLGKRDIPFLKDFSRHAALSKEIGTYYAKRDTKTGEIKGMLTCVSKGDHIVNHKLNHNATVTTRLSSSDPNLQNLPRKDKSAVKRGFISRFGDQGFMIEADYSQLEVVIQGVLSGDPNLCNDLRNRIDFHCKRVAARENIAYDSALYWCKDETFKDYEKWNEIRFDCKSFSFQMAYGAGAKTIAEDTGMPLATVELMFAKEEEMYPLVNVFHSKVEESVQLSAIAYQREVVPGVWKTYRRGQWQAPTGTLYTWNSYDAPAWLKKRGIEENFKPTEIKNYPTQGTGGEIMQTMLGRLWREKFVATDNYGGMALLVNTVHDCAWADTHKSVTLQVGRDIKEVLSDVPDYFNKRYDMDITVPFPVDVEYGHNMYELHHLDLSGETPL